MESSPLAVGPEQLDSDPDKDDKPTQEIIHRLSDHEEDLPRKLAPEAGQLHGIAPVERIGHVLVTAEAAKRRGEVERSEEGEVLSASNGYHRVENWSRAEVLAASEGITVEGTTLRHIYETHLIGEKALRRLVAEHLLGHDLVRALHREIVEHEIDFERDPALRDQLVPTEDNAEEKGSVVAQETFHTLVKKAEADLGADDKEIHYDEPKPKSEQIIPSPQAQNHTHPSRLLDSVMIIAIGVLLIIIIFLYIFHR
jgi:hypothetical protein